ncbi:MAG: molybdopterin molybdotransferase MoeA [Dehalococcoidales bacterium]|nr:molybdopterin molybdotransferase MoeA [Dehalococcoidales bacterium]
MPEFFKVVSPLEALRTLDLYLTSLTDIEEVNITGALGRTTAETIRAPADLPSFRRSTMDGYAVYAADTHGASEGLPAYLRVAGEMPMGRLFPLIPHRGEAVVVHTGSPLPEGSDAVVMIENTQQVNDSTIEVMRPAAKGENLIEAGDDIRSGDLLFSSGHLLRPQDIGGLAALGITAIKVFRQPRVGIISTGDEIIPPEKEPSPGEVRDINSYTISALVRQAGGVPVCRSIVPDNLERLKQAASAGLEQADLLVISAGSSVSIRDMTAAAITSLGNPGILVYGVAVRPGKPTILAAAGNKPVFGLPGNPVSTVVTFDLFVRPAIYKVGGCRQPPERPLTTARLTHNIPSIAGREDYVPVKLERRNEEWLATPVFGESNLITTLVRADGLAVVPLDINGLYAGETARVRQF